MLSYCVLPYLVFTLHKKMWLIVAVVDDEVLRGLWGKGAGINVIRNIFSALS